MKAVMPARIHGQFPRWGYLDRYATNEYMPRALGLALALTLAAIGVAQLWRTLPPDVTLQMIERPMPHFTEPTDILPPPAIENVGTISPPKATRTRPQIPSFIVVDDEPVIDTDWSTEGSSSGLDVTAEGIGDPDVLPIPEGGEVVSGWPSPDDIIVVEKEPELVMMQQPVYPEIAREAGLEGTVLVRMLVDTEGAVRDVRVLQSVLGFEEAAVAAARTAVFRPAMQQDRPVAVWVVMPIEFRLR